VSYYLILFFLTFYIISLDLPRTAQLKLCFILFLLFSGLRFNSGYDYPIYYELIKKDNYAWIEPFSKILMDIGRITDPIYFFTASSLITIFFYYRAFYNYCKDKEFSTIGILSLISFPITLIDSLGFVRQFIAISIFVFVASTIERKKVYSILLILLASLFHKAILITLPLVIFRSILFRHYNISLYILLWLAALVIGPIALVYLVNTSGLYTDYITKHVSSNGYKIYALFSVVFFYFILNLSYLKENKKYIFLFNCFFIGLLFYSASLPFGLHASRISWGLLAVHPLIFGIILYNKEILERSAFLLVCLTLLAASLYLSSQNQDRDFLNQYRPVFLTDKYKRDWIINRSIQTEININ